MTAENLQQEESITFLGTAGARFMVSRQILASGGIWLKLDGTEILLDPGPGSIVQATKRKLDPEKLSAIIVSHRHLDHSNDTNIMVEAMTGGGFKKHGVLFAPGDALGSEPIVYTYVRNYLEGVEVMEEGKSYRVGGVSFTTPVRHIHQVETYGATFTTAQHTFSYITDSRYFDGLIEKYRGELLIISTARLDAGHPFDHLSTPDVARIVTALKPKTAILTHFGMTVWRAKPWLVAEKLSQETGIRVIAARDGMKFDLGKLEDQQAEEGI